MTDPIEAEIDAVYAGPLDGFVERRKVLATKLKKAGDRERSAVVAGLAKPTASAWLVGDLARGRDADFEAMLDVGLRLRGAMRAALQGEGDPQAVAKLQREQRERIEALLEVGRARLESGGLAATDAVVGRTRVSLTTLSTMGGWGELAPGRLAKDLDPLDMAALAALLDVPVPARPPPAPATRPALRLVTGGADDAARRASEQAAKRAEEEAAKRAAIEDATRAEREAKQAEERAAGAVRDAAAAHETAVSRASSTEGTRVAADAEATDLEARARKAREDASAASRAASQARADLDQATRLRDCTQREWDAARARADATTAALTRAKG